MQCEFHYITLIIRYVALSLQCEWALSLLVTLFVVCSIVHVPIYLDNFSNVRKRKENYSNPASPKE